jgi:hypothetical protein
MKVEFQTGIPIPRTGAGRPRESCYDAMQVGDSFFGDWKNPLSGLRATKKTFPERKFTSRSVVEGGISGVRVWRIE